MFTAALGLRILGRSEPSTCYLFLTSAWSFFSNFGAASKGSKYFSSIDLCIAIAITLLLYSKLTTSLLFDTYSSVFAWNRITRAVAGEIRNYQRACLELERFCLRKWRFKRPGGRIWPDKYLNETKKAVCPGWSLGRELQHGGQCLEKMCAVKCLLNVEQLNDGRYKIITS